MQANTSAENAAAVRHSVKNNMITSSSDGVKEPDNSPLGGDGGQNVTLGDLFSGVSKIDKTKMQAALLELLKKEMQTGKNASELFDEPCDMDEHQSNGNQVPQTVTFPSQDVRLKRSASFPEINNSLNQSAGRPAYNWGDSDDDVLDTAWLSASESMSPRERDRWRKSLYSVYVGQLPADITKKELYELFSEAGNVQDLHLAESLGKSFTFGFVRFASLQEAKEAVQSCHSRLLGGRHIRVEFACETQRLLDKDGGDFSSDTERDGKLLRRDYPSVQRYKPLPADEADEKMVQWKLRQCTAKLKSSHACYVRDYMRTGEAARPDTQTPSEVGHDQEETLNKIQEILKMVAEIPGTEIAATAFGEQGPEHTIMSWYQETESDNKNTQLSSQYDHGDTTQSRNEYLQQSAIDSNQRLSAQITEMSHVNGSADDMTFNRNGEHTCKVLSDGSRCNVFPACGNTAQECVSPVQGHGKPDGAAGNELYSTQSRERASNASNSALAQVDLQTCGTSNTSTGSISKQSIGLVNGIAPSAGREVYSGQGVERPTEASAASCAQGDPQLLNNISPTTAHNTPTDLEQHLTSSSEDTSATDSSSTHCEAANNSSSECSPIQGLKSVQSGFGRGERHNGEPLTQPKFDCTIGPNTGVFASTGRGRPSPPKTTCKRPGMSDVLSPRQQQPRNNPQLPIFEPNPAMLSQPISRDEDNKSLPTARRLSLESDNLREFREMGLCDFYKSPDRRFRSRDDTATVPDSITMNPFKISPGIQSMFCAKPDSSFPPVSQPSAQEQEETKPYLPSDAPSITRQQLTQLGVGLPDQGRQSSVSGTRVEDNESQITSPSAVFQSDDSKVYRYPTLSQKKSPRTSTPGNRGVDSAEGTSATQYKYPVPIFKKPANAAVTQEKSGASDAGEFTDPQTDNLAPFLTTSQTAGNDSMLVNMSGVQLCSSKQASESTAHLQTSTQQAANQTTNSTQSQNQLRDQNPVDQCTRDCVTSHNNQPITSKVGTVTPDPRMNASHNRIPQSLLGDPLGHISQPLGMGHVNPSVDIYSFLLSQQIAQQQRNPFFGSLFPPVQPPQFTRQFPGSFGFPMGHSACLNNPYFGPGPRQSPPGNILRAQLPHGLVEDKLPHEFTPPQRSPFPFHHMGTNTWPLQQRPVLFPQNPPFQQQNFCTPPRQPFTGNAVGNAMNPRKLAPFLTGSPLFADSRFSVPLGRIRDTRKDSSVAKTAPTIESSSARENSKEQNRLSDLFCTTDERETRKEDSSCTENNTEGGSLSHNSQINSSRLLTSETVDVTVSSSVVVASATKHDLSDRGLYDDKTVDKLFADPQSKRPAVAVKLNTSSSDSVNSSDTTQSSSTDDTSSSDSSLLVEHPSGKESNSSLLGSSSAQRNKKLAPGLQVAINTSSKDPGYSSTSSGSEELSEGTERRRARAKNTRPRTGRGSGDSGIVSPGDDLSKNEITLLELKMELHSIEAENTQLRQSLPKASSPVLSSRIYPNRASAALKQKIKELEVQLLKEKEIITARNSEQELLYEREKLEAAFDRQLLKQLEVELAVGNITNKVRLARMQRELLGLYQQLSVLE